MGLISRVSSRTYRESQINSKMFVSKALRFGILKQSKRTAIQHRPRWANENQGQYFGSMWLRRQMVENGEVCFSLGMIALVAIPAFITEEPFILVPTKIKNGV